MLAALAALALATLPARDVVTPEPQQWMEIVSGAPESVTILKSRAADIDCTQARATQTVTLKADTPKRIPLALARQASPGSGYYAWDVCFVVAGRHFRGWQGIDPGPGASFHLHCRLGVTDDPLRYLCSEAEIVRNLRNYAEYTTMKPARYTDEPCPGYEEAPNAMDCSHDNGAADFIGHDKEQFLTVAAGAPITLQYRMSRTPGDVDCASPQISRWTRLNTVHVTPGKPARIDFEFNRQFEPSSAFYEWRVCFVVDHTLFRAWRGYDPGPGATIHVPCEITTARLQTHDTTGYLCGTPELGFPTNDTLYARSCGGEGCEFKSKAEYEVWRSLGNPTSDAEQDEMALTALLYALHHESTYLGSNKKDFKLYVQVHGKDPPPAMLARIAKEGDTIYPISAQPKNAVTMAVAVSRFTITEPDTAKGMIGAQCGTLCGSFTRVTLVKRDGAWTVGAMEMESIQ